MRLDITYPSCGAEFDLGLARNDDDWRELVNLVMSLPAIVHRPVWQYLGLFQGKQKLRSLKMLRIVKELLPMIKAANVKRGHAIYAVPAEQFARAMTYLVDARPASLVLPLKGNGYLLGMLANQAEQVLVKSENKKDEVLRKRVVKEPTAPEHVAVSLGRNEANDSDWQKTKKKLGVKTPKNEV